MVFWVLEISGGFGEPLRYFAGVWGSLGDYGGGGSGVSLRCFGGSPGVLGVSGNGGVSKSFGGLWGCLRPLTPPPAVCVLYTQRPGTHQWQEVSDPIGGGQPISMLGCAQLASGMLVCTQPASQDVGVLAGQPIISMLGQ